MILHSSITNGISVFDRMFHPKMRRGSTESRSSAMCFNLSNFSILSIGYKSAYELVLTIQAIISFVNASSSSGSRALALI